jgi:hypothetical protein
MAVRFSALSAGRHFPQEDSWYSFLLEKELGRGCKEVVMSLFEEFVSRG